MTPSGFQTGSSSPGAGTNTACVETVLTRTSFSHSCFLLWDLFWLAAGPDTRWLRAPRRQTRGRESASLHLFRVRQSGTSRKARSSLWICVSGLSAPFRNYFFHEGYPGWGSDVLNYAGCGRRSSFPWPAPPMTDSRGSRLSSWRQLFWIMWGMAAAAVAPSFRLRGFIAAIWSVGRPSISALHTDLPLAHTAPCFFPLAVVHHLFIPSPVTCIVSLLFAQLLCHNLSSLVV